MHLEFVPINEVVLVYQMSTAAILCCSAWGDLIQWYLFIASGSTMQQNEAGKKMINDTMKKEEEERGKRKISIASFRLACRITRCK